MIAHFRSSWGTYPRHMQSYLAAIACYRTWQVAVSMRQVWIYVGLPHFKARDMSYYSDTKWNGRVDQLISPGWTKPYRSTPWEVSSSSAYWRVPGTTRQAQPPEMSWDRCQSMYETKKNEKTSRCCFNLNCELKSLNLGGSEYASPTKDAPCSPRGEIHWVISH